MPTSSAAVSGDFIPTPFYTHTTKLGEPLESVSSPDQIETDLSTVAYISSIQTTTGGFFNTRLFKFGITALLIIIVGAYIAVPLAFILPNSGALTTNTTMMTTSTTTAPLQWNTTGITLAGQVSVNNANSNCLNLPIGIWLDSSNTLYVADGNNHRVQRFSPGNTTGTTVAGSSSGSSGSSASLLNYPNDIAVDSNGNVYIVDSDNNRVQLWNVNANSGITIAGNGTAGNSTTLLNSPRGITFGSNTNTFYISDANNNRVMKYTLNSTVGTLVAGGNGAGTSNTQLSSPRGLYFDSSTNSLFIANSGANNVVQWVIGALNWTLVAGNINGIANSGPSDLNTPYDVTLDSMKNVYVPDRNNQRVQFFLSGQLNGTTIAGVSGTMGTSAGKLDQPLSAALDSQSNLYVSDSFNYRIQKFLDY